MKTIGVIGAGSWGTALATVVADKGHTVRIWDIDEKHLRSMDEHRENVDYLPGVHLGDNIQIVYDTADALKDSDVVLFSGTGAALQERAGIGTAVYKRGCAGNKRCQGHRTENTGTHVADRCRENWI